MAAGTKLFLYCLVLQAGTLFLRPDGRGWHSQCKGWEPSFKTDQGILCNCLMCRNFGLDCPSKQPLFLKDRFPNYDTKQKDKTDSIKTRQNKVNKVLSMWREDTFLRQNALVPLFIHSFTVCLNGQFTVSNRSKVFLSLNTFHCLTLHNGDFLFSSISHVVIGFSYCQVQRLLEKCANSRIRACLWVFMTCCGSHAHAHFPTVETFS